MTLQFALCNLHFAVVIRLSKRNSSMQNAKCKLKNAKSPSNRLGFCTQNVKGSKFDFCTLQSPFCNYHKAINAQWLNAECKMQIEKCKIEAIHQNGYQSSQDNFAICTLQFSFCNYHKAIFHLRRLREYKTLYEGLIKIPKGKTMTYSELATRSGVKYTEVLITLMRNPFQVLIPCHRLLTQKGTLMGFYPLGKEVKKRLLEIEGIRCDG